MHKCKRGIKASSIRLLVHTAKIASSRGNQDGLSASQSEHLYTFYNNNLKSWSLVEDNGSKKAELWLLWSKGALLKTEGETFDEGETIKVPTCYKAGRLL